ncbi:MAG: fibronectin type III domain-containing protein [Bacteroidales bacterium]|nr:fibronectin type III domain-containing protein [Bacteroidales bacterium]
MKKILFSVMAIVALAFTTSCETTKEEPTPADPTALAAPVLTVANQTEDGFTISWAAVENAAGYTYHMVEEKVTTETSVTFTGLAAGSYTVRVKANAPAGSKEFVDSQFADITVTIEAALPDVWFTQEVWGENDPDYGLTPANSMVFSWEGIGVVKVEYIMFPAEIIEGGIADLSNDEIVAIFEEAGYPMDVVDDPQFLAYINGDGLVSYFDQLDPETEYVLISYAYHESGAVCDVRDSYTTEAVEENPLRDQWLGAWTLTATHEVSMAPEVSYTEKEGTCTLNIVAISGYSDVVAVYGWTKATAISEDVPAIGYIGENGELILASGEVMGEENQGYVPTWAGFAKVEDNYTFVRGEYETYTFALEGDVAEAERYVGELNDGRSFEVLGMELIASSSNGIAVYITEWPFVFMGGDMTLTKAEQAPRRASFAMEAQRANVPALLPFEQEVLFF